MTKYGLQRPTPQPNTAGSALKDSPPISLWCNRDGRPLLIPQLGGYLQPNPIPVAPQHLRLRLADPTRNRPQRHLRPTTLAHRIRLHKRPTNVRSPTHAKPPHAKKRSTSNGSNRSRKQSRSKPDPRRRRPPRATRRQRRLGRRIRRTHRTARRKWRRHRRRRGHSRPRCHRLPLRTVRGPLGWP